MVKEKPKEKAKSEPEDDFEKEIDEMELDDDEEELKDIKEDDDEFDDVEVDEEDKGKETDLSKVSISDSVGVRSARGPLAAVRSAGRNIRA